MSKTYHELDKETIAKIKSRCEHKIKQIDELPESLQNMTSTAVRYAYNSILQIIKEGE